MRLRNQLICSLGVLLISSAPAWAADLTAGKSKYDALCASCHGPKGGGDGPVAASLPPNMKPTNLQSGTFKFATDEDKFRELMLKGGIGVGLSPMMPPMSALTPDEIKNLYGYVISFKSAT